MKAIAFILAAIGIALMLFGCAHTVSSSATSQIQEKITSHEVAVSENKESSRTTAVSDATATTTEAKQQTVKIDQVIEKWTPTKDGKWTYTKTRTVADTQAAAQLKSDESSKQAETTDSAKAASSSERASLDEVVKAKVVENKVTESWWKKWRMTIGVVSVAALFLVSWFGRAWLKATWVRFV